MAISHAQRRVRFNMDRGGLLLPALLLWAAGIVLGLTFLWFESDANLSDGRYYLLPWAALAGIVILAPSVYLYYKGEFNLFHPLIFAAWSYVFPAFVIGAVLVNFEMVDWYFLSFIEDPQYNIPLSLVYISIGFIGLTAGYFLPIGKKIAEKVEPKLPQWNWQPENVWLAGLLLLATGIAVNAFGFLQGLVGFQRNIDVSIFDGLVFFLLIILTAGMVLLWLAIFSVRQRTGAFYLIVGLLVAFIPIRMAVLGSRSSLLIGLIPVVYAFVASGRKIHWKTGLTFGVLAAVGLFIGVTYGTTFRQIKGSEARVAAGDYFGQVIATIDHLSEKDLFVTFADSGQALANRVENLSTVAVVISNHDQLAQYEAAYGIENNIINDLFTSFIPRFVWPNKPGTSDARAYSDLYFDYGENSFAVSPFADLFRNFGPIGIPIGMLLIGIYLRFIWDLLYDSRDPAMWKKVAYFLLLTVVSYEAFYATIFPSTIRTVFVLAVCFWIANLFVPRRRTIV